MKEIIERKIQYDTKIVEHKCHLLSFQNRRIVLFHLIEEPFTMTVNDLNITIPIGSYTIAYYWLDRPYNLYFWRDQEGNYLASYFNIVKSTKFEDNIVTFEDLIIDVLVLPNGKYFILDEDELPNTLETFENGFAKHALEKLLRSIHDILGQTILESQGIYNHKRFIPLLDKGIKAF
ncbi:DUF402 domain-containing protein [Ureibacillus thermophilus]|uniref:DUF402 domain-containing protein n=1 Tax=Ureibacillus thermophilus TaxID=367743 RepID=A0A4P6URK7_9BACL|nr:DUF402 domain-containing protein [Ureibacillus thermophilus]QBK25763.1 DUF402 domain-containing protein [Ureibacillus thermophilus]